MTDFILDYYNWIKAFHLIAVISWMAGMLYLPRLFVYHADAVAGSELSETLKIMERKLLRIIINPAMAVTWLLGLAMLFANTALMTSGGWMHAKLAAVALLSAFHGYLAKQRKVFLRDANTKPAKFYIKINEIPTILMIVIVIMVIVQPF